jgi:hypothetical protein
MAFLGMCLGNKKCQENQASKVSQKYDYKNNNSYNKYGAQATAYANGIDPKASMWGGIASLGQSAGQTASSIFGGGASGGLGGLFGGGQNSAQSEGINPMLLIGGVLVLILIMKK